MSFREDFFRILEGKKPLHDIPYYNMMGAMAGQKNGVVMFPLGIADMGKIATTGYDSWGLEYVMDIYKMGFIHKPGKILLKDVRQWRDVVKAPDHSNYDWEAGAEKDLANVQFDKETQVSYVWYGGDFFLKLVGFMGFEGALVAMYEEPTAVKEMFDYIADYYCMVVDKIATLYKPDVMVFGDDNAADKFPFVSYELFQELLLPYYKRVFDVAKQHGIIIGYHNCGKCEAFMDDMVEIGMQVWNCATTYNDLEAFEKRHGNRILLELTPRIYPHFTEEQARQLVRDTIDKYGPGGYIVWIGGTAVTTDEGRQVDAWVFDEVAKYGKGFYDRLAATV